MNEVNEFSDRDEFDPAMEMTRYNADIRLRCLKLAVQSCDTEMELKIDDILRRAAVLFSYAMTGIIPTWCSPTVGGSDESDGSDDDAGHADRAAASGD